MFWTCLVWETKAAEPHYFRKTPNNKANSKQQKPPSPDQCRPSKAIMSCDLNKTLLLVTLHKKKKQKYVHENFKIISHHLWPYKLWIHLTSCHIGLQDNLTYLHTHRICVEFVYVLEQYCSFTQTVKKHRIFPGFSLDLSF